MLVLFIYVCIYTHPLFEGVCFNSRHPGPRRVWKVGSGAHLLPPLPGNPGNPGNPGDPVENNGRLDFAVKNNEFSTFRRKMGSKFQEFPRGGPQETKAAQSDPMGALSRPKAPQREPKGAPGPSMISSGKFWRSSGRPWQSSGRVYIQKKLPINRPSGRYVIYIYIVCYI